MDQLIDVIVIGKQFQEKSIPLYVMNTQIQPVFRFLTCNEQLELNAVTKKYEYSVETVPAAENTSAVEQLALLVAKVKNPFMVIFDERIEVCLTNLEKVTELLKNDEVGAISGILLNGVVPEVMFPIINSYSKNQKIEFMTACQKYGAYTRMCDEVSLEIQHGNYQLALFHPQLATKDIFAYELYKRIDELLVDSFYRIKEYNLKNYVFGGAFSFRVKDKSIYEKRFAKVLELWTGKYLSYPKPFYSGKDELKPLVKRWKIIESHQLQIKPKNILFIVPSDVFVNGLNVHVQDLISKIKDVNFYCLMPSFSNNEVKYFDFVQYFNGVEIERYKIPYASETHISVTESKEYQDMVQIIMENYQIDIVHIHIMALGHTLDAPKVAKKLGKKVVLSLHDLYYLSGDFTQKDITIAYQSKVLKKKYAIQNGESFYQKWHQDVQNMIDNVDLVVGFSQSTIDIYQKWYHINQHAVIPHGYNYNKRYHLTNPRIQGMKIKCVYYGRVEEEKGSDLLYHLAQLLPEIEIHILGVIADGRFEKQNKLPKNITVYGRYQKHDLPKLLKKINPHFVILPSKWHETFAYTLTEAYLYGLVPIVTPFGALKERVENSGVGFVSEKADAQSLADVIKKSSQMSNEAWQQLLTKIDQVHLTTVEEMVHEYKELYELTTTATEKQTRQAYLEQQQSQSTKAKQLLYTSHIDEKINSLNYYYEQSFKLAKMENSRGLKALKTVWTIRNQSRKQR